MAEEEITQDGTMEPSSEQLEDTDKPDEDDQLSPDEVESLLAESDDQTDEELLLEQEAEVLDATHEKPAPQAQDQVAATPVKLDKLDGTAPALDHVDLDLVLDVHLPVVVELGRAKKLVKEILGLQRGSVITLDKMAGEPANLMINSIVMATREIVVIDDNFGIRITKMLSRLDRLRGIAQSR